MNNLSTQKPSQRLPVRWKTLKGLIAIILFVTISILTEYLIISYATNLGVQEKPENKILGLISPLFHLVPLTTIIALFFSWTYLTNYVSVKPYEIVKGKGGFTAKHEKELKSESNFDKIKHAFLGIKDAAYFWKKRYFAKATIKSALIILLIFTSLILLVSFLAYPRLMYVAISSAYQNNPSLFNFVKGTAEALAPIGGVFSTVNNAILSVAPGFRAAVSDLGMIFRPLVNLDNVEKYLVFQNIAAWVSAMLVLLYGELAGKSYQYRKK